MGVMKWLAALVVAVPVIVIASVYARNKAVGPVGWAKDDALKHLKRQMKDPDSTVIRESWVVVKTDANGDSTISVCGLVDGHNSFGAYSGGTRFVSQSFSSKRLDTFDTSEVVLDDPEKARVAESVHMLSGFDSVYWNQNCVDGQHPPVTPKA